MPKIKKEQTTMTPNGTQSTTATLQKTVFDLQNFDDVKLVKTVQLPTPITSVEDALAAVGNDASKLIAIINAGLVENAKETAREDSSDWHALNEEGEPLEESYEGVSADEKKTKLINNAVLNMAKMFAGGSWDSLKKEQKREMKEKAIDMIRTNPAMLASIQG